MVYQIQLAKQIGAVPLTRGYIVVRARSLAQAESDHLEMRVTAE